ncbi:MAG TPA: ABC transporter permease [Actinomycetota bacterium]|nr:ABC transporter permease [Actinomycetota bacterium]
MRDVALSPRGARWLRAFFLLFVAFLYAPIAILVIFSFNANDLPVFPLTGFTVRWYLGFLANEDLLAALRTSAFVAGLSSAITVCLGVLSAIALVRRRVAGRSVLTGLLLSPLVIPYIVFGISLLMLFKTLAVPLSLFTVTVAHVVLSLPYTILILAPRLERISASLEEAARDLGANGVRTFRWITLPLILPAVVSAFLVAFTLSFDEYAVASFVVGRDVTYPIYLFSQFRFPRRLPQVIALAVVLMAFSAAVVIAAELIRRASERRLRAAGVVGA